MTESIGVGIVGADAHRGWAREAHVTAVRALEGLELVAVAHTDQRRADAAAAAFGASGAYADAAQLVRDPSVDVVVVASPVSTHLGVILDALGHGKHVVSEWPVTNDVADTRRVVAAAERSGLLVAVGLQARRSPAVRALRRLVADGAIGRVVEADVHATTAGFGPVVPSTAAYLEDPAAGMNLPTIQTAHTLDLAVHLLGPLATVSAMTSVQYSRVEVAETGRRLDRAVADHVLVHGRLASGAPLNVRVVGGRPVDDTPFRLDVVGESGTLRLTGGGARGFQASALSLQLDGTPVEVAPGELVGLPASVVNVAGIYAGVRDVVLGRAAEVPSAADAVQLHQLLATVLASAEEARVLAVT